MIDKKKLKQDDDDCFLLADDSFDPHDEDFDADEFNKGIDEFDDEEELEPFEVDDFSFKFEEEK